MDGVLVLTGVLTAITGLAVAVASQRPAMVDAGAVLSDLDGVGPRLDEFSHRLSEPFLSRLLRPLGRQLAGRVGALLPSQRIEQIRHKLLVAGELPTLGPEEFVVVQGISAGAGGLAGLVLAQFLGESGFGAVRLVMILVAVGVFLPVGWLNRKRNARQASIRKDLPDVLDLLAISVEAGVGFEGALDVVTQHFDSPLSREFSRTLQEMELGLPRREALHNLKRRTEVPELSNFVLILLQADALGMPMGRVLRTQATEMRSRRRQWAREKAGKLPVKIMLPLVVFILPALFVVVLGPAAISISRSL